MAEGRSNQAIAERMFVTLRAVEKHVTSIFTKLGLPASTGRPPPRPRGARVPAPRRSSRPDRTDRRDAGVWFPPVVAGWPHRALGRGAKCSHVPHLARTVPFRHPRDRRPRRSTASTRSCGAQAARTSRPRSRTPPTSSPWSRRSGSTSSAASRRASRRSPSRRPARPRVRAPPLRGDRGRARLGAPQSSRSLPIVRTTFVAATALALVGYVFYPAAPPRLSELGFSDTVTSSTGLDLSSDLLGALYNPFAAVPSLHFGYALIVGVVLAVVAQGRAGGSPARCIRPRCS